MKHSAAMITKQLFQLSALSLALTLAGCGGGDDAGGDTLKPEPCVGICGGTTGGGNSGEVTDPVTDEDYTLFIESDVSKLIINKENPSATTAVVSVRVQDEDFGVVSGQEVMFKLPDPTITGVLNTNSSKVTTDENGIATITLQVIKDLNQKQMDYLENSGVKVVASLGGTDGIPLTLKAEYSGSVGVSEPVNIDSFGIYNSADELVRFINAQGATARIKVTDEDNIPIEGALVTFDGGGVKFSSSNNSVLTEEDGIARIILTPNDPNDTGSYQISATVNYEGNTATTAPYNISVQATDIEIVDFKAAKTRLDAGETTLLTLVTKDAITEETQNNVAVDFTTTCGSFSESTVSSSNQGNVSVNYNTIDDTGMLCEGKPIITAIPTNDNSKAKQISIDINAIQATSILYPQDQSTILGAKSSGSTGTGKVEFIVFSNSTRAIGKQVEVDINYAPADFSFGTLNNRDTIELQSDAEGKVTVPVYPGDIPGPVELKASLVEDPSIFALSKNVAVATSRPAQGGITIRADKWVILDNAPDTAQVTVSLTDRQGNYVPAGTVVSFVSEGGTITPNCSTDATGECSVTLRSQNPRPADGRVSVLAYVEGDKKYIDINGNNVYDKAEDFIDTNKNGVYDEGENFTDRNENGEYDEGDTLYHNIHTAFRDDNENKKYDADLGEFKYSRGQAGELACGNDDDAWFNEPNVASDRGDEDEYKCNDELNTILRKQAIFGFANDTPIFESEATENSIFMRIFGNASKTLPMPTGTTVAFVGEDRTEDNVEGDCKVEMVGGVSPTNPLNLNRVYFDPANPVKYVNDFYNFNNEVNYAASVTGCTSGDKVAVIVTAPNDVTTTRRLEGLLPAPTPKPKPTVTNVDYVSSSEEIKLDIYGNASRDSTLPVSTRIRFKGDDSTPDNDKDCKVRMTEGKTPTNATSVNSDAVHYEASVKGCTVDDKVTVVITTPDNEETSIDLESYIP